jgi:hypothetical protein
MPVSASMITSNRCVCELGVVEWSETKVGNLQKRVEIGCWQEFTSKMSVETSQHIPTSGFGELYTHQFHSIHI